MPKPISVRTGQLEFLKLNLQSWGWRDAYQWFLGLNWPAFIVFIASIYIIINLLFVAFYSLGSNCIAGMRPGVSLSPTPTPTRLLPQLPRSYRVWGYPWTPLAFSAAATAISVNLWLVHPVRSSIGLAVIVLGIPFFNFWRRQALCSTIQIT
jgi:hypothetical protein